MILLKSNIYFYYLKGVFLLKKTIVTLTSTALLLGFGGAPFAQASEMSNTNKTVQNEQASSSDMPDGISLENVDEQEYP